VRAGQQLMEAGVVIELPAAYTSDLIFLQDASLGKPEASHPPGEFRLTAEKVTSDPFFASAELRWQPSMHARRYRVLLSHEKDFDPLLAVKTVVIPSLTLTALPAARELFWKVEAISPGGRRFNADGPRAFTSSALKKLVGVTFASDMKWVKATMGAGANRPVHRDETYYKKPITITGKIYQKGIWTHSFNDERPADVVLDVSGRNFRMFKAEVGLDDASGGGSVQFQVLVDGQLKAETAVMRPRAVHQLNVDVSGAKQVTLRVLNGGDGNTGDHAAWGFARFSEAGAKDHVEHTE